MGYTMKSVPSLKRTNPKLLRGKRRRDQSHLGGYSYWYNWFNDRKQSTTNIHVLRQYILGKYSCYHEIHKPYQDELRHQYQRSRYIQKDILVDVMIPVIRSSFPAYEDIMENKFKKGSSQFRSLCRLKKRYSSRKKRLLKRDAHREKYT